MTIRAHDLISAYIAVLPSDIHCNVLLPAKQLIDALTVLGTPTDITTHPQNNQHVMIASAIGECQLYGDDPGEFPWPDDFCAPDRSDFWDIDIADLLHYVGKDELRPAFFGIHYANNLTATDANILKSIPAVTPGPHKILCPDILVPGKNTIFCDADRFYVITPGGGIATARYIDAQYPQYQAVIPSDEICVHSLILGPQAIAAIKGMKIAMHITFVGNTITAMFSDDRVIVINSDCKASTPVAYRPDLLLTIIGNDTALKLRFPNPRTAAITSAGALIMPIQNATTVKTKDTETDEQPTPSELAERGVEDECEGMIEAASDDVDDLIDDLIADTVNALPC